MPCKCSAEACLRCQTEMLATLAGKRSHGLPRHPDVLRDAGCNLPRRTGRVPGGDVGSSTVAQAAVTDPGLLAYRGDPVTEAEERSPTTLSRSARGPRRSS